MRQYFVYSAVVNALFVNTQDQHCKSTINDYKSVYLNHIVSAQGHACIHTLTALYARLAVIDACATPMYLVAGYFIAHVWTPAIK